MDWLSILNGSGIVARKNHMEGVVRLDWPKLYREKKLWYRVHKSSVAHNYHIALLQVPLCFWLFAFQGFYEASPLFSTLVIICSAIHLALRAFGFLFF